MTGEPIEHTAGYAAGYQTALNDLLRALEQGGVPNVLNWLASNTNDTERTDAAIKAAAPRQNGKPSPDPIFSARDVDTLTAAVQHWIGHVNSFDYERIGRLFVNLAKARQAANEAELAEGGEFR